MSEEIAPTQKTRGKYVVSTRVQRALTALASGTAKTQAEAAGVAGISDRALRAAIKRPNVQIWMKEMIATTLGLGAMRAAKRMVELVESENSMAAFRSAQFTLATGAGVAPPDRPTATVNINANIAPGYVINLTKWRPVGDPEPDVLLLDTPNKD